MPVQTKGPPPQPVPEHEHLTTRLYRRARSDPGREILRYPSGDGWAALTWAQVAERVRAIAGGLVAAGVGAGDRVALLSAQRVEWTLTDLAVLTLGAVTVPIYETSSPRQCAWILSDAGCVAAVVESHDHARTLAEGRRDGPDLAEVVVIESGGLDALAARGRGERATVDRLGETVTGANLASLVYTSGTTGNPKGCMLTHANLLWVARQAQGALPMLFGPQESTLNFLPLAHAFARIIQFGCLENDTVLGYARSFQTMSEDLRSFRPTFLLGVPHAFEKMHDAARERAQGLRRRVFDFAVRTAEDLARTPEPGAGLALRRAVADRLVYTRLRAALGGRLDYALSGGAALPGHVGTFFSAAGVPLLEGYGLTETSAPATVNRPGAHRPGTVGRPLPGVEARVGEDGQLHIRGGGVFRGYWCNEAATREALDGQGWFATGDLGDIDGDGNVSVTGRCKDTIVTAGGKNVSPTALEEPLAAHPLVAQAMVVGDGRPFVAALLTLDDDALAGFAREHGLDDDPAALRGNAAVAQELQGVVDETNRGVSRAEAVRSWRVVGRPFDQEHDEITPTLKLRRAVIAEHFADEIDGLYEEPDHGGGRHGSPVPAMRAQVPRRVRGQGSYDARPRRGSRGA